MFPNVHPRVQSVRKGEPADVAGLKPGDVVTAVNGEGVQLARHLSEAIGEEPGEADHALASRVPARPWTSR